MMCMRATYYLKSQLSAFHTKSQIMKWSKRCHCNGLNDELENVQKRAARFVTRNYSYETGSMTGILEELKWETLQKRRKDNRLILLYKGLKGKARIPTDDL